ncbi:hypothetical protein PLESTM_001827900 [Pleodorina starrii]|nr:hypothetical protein PLESTM_001827900 [Pleodorina starrii]
MRRSGMNDFVGNVLRPDGGRRPAGSSAAADDVATTSWQQEEQEQQQEAAAAAAAAEPDSSCALPYVGIRRGSAAEGGADGAGGVRDAAANTSTAVVRIALVQAVCRQVMTEGRD